MVKFESRHVLYQVREKLGVSKKQFAKSIGISATTLKNIEEGCFESLSTKTIYSIMNFFECSYDVAVGLSTNMYFDSGYFERIKRKLK